MESITLRQQVRAECGKISPSSSELSDTDITSEAGNTIAIIANRLPQKVLRYITSVKNQRQYSTHANTKRVQIVFPAEDVGEALVDLGSPMAIDEPESNDEYWFPSLWTIRQMRRTRGRSRMNFHFDPINKTLDIDPMPDEAGKKYYYISVEKAGWTLAALPTDFEPLVVTGTVWKCLEIVALYRSKLGGTMRAGGFVDYPVMGLREYIDAKKDEFYDELRIMEKLHSL